MTAEPQHPVLGATPVPSTAPGDEPGISRGTTLVMAAAAGLAVANIYYNQPLIGLLSRDFVGQGLVGYVPTATQMGYAIGILTLVPLGDRMERRKLIVGQMLALSAALLLAALAPSALVLALASVVIGITATVPQQIIPFAADLAAPRTRGSTIGMVMSGLLCGILLARTVSGFIGEAFGWRAVYGVGIVIALATAAALAATLPRRLPATRMPYRQLIASTLALVRDEPRLRAASAVQTCLFASFSIFWTVLALRLEQPPYRMGADIAGLFGLVGAAGALAAPLSGRIADRYGPRAGIGVGIVAVLLCWAILGATTSILALVVGVILLDAGVQGAMIGHQHIIFALRPEARNRINSVYMGALFLGGATGSAVAMTAWRHGGWPPVCLIGGGVVLLALVLHGLSGRAERSNGA